MTHPEGFQDIDPRVLLGQWCRLFFSALRAGGVQDVVLSPGSRNTPLIWGAVADPELRAHSVIDERSAGFFGLGLARASARPVALVCTSGSAGAHYYPSVIEAHQAGVPLIVVTADRPLHLQDCGAPQTIRQPDLYGRFALSAPSLGEPRPATSDLSALVRMTRQAVARSQGPAPGPVHVNFPVAKPLEPLLPETESERQFEAHCSKILQATDPLPPGRVSQPHAVIDAFCRLSQLDARGTLITLGPVGHTEASFARRMAVRWGRVCLSELPQAGPAFPLAQLSDAFNAGRLTPPRRIVHIGPPCVSSAWNNYLKESSSELFVLPGTAHLEPTGRARSVLTGDLLTLLQALEDEAPPSSHDGAPASEWRDWESSYRAALAAELDRNDVGAPLSEAHATWEVLRCAAAASQVLLGNSLPLRLATWVAPALPDSPQRFTCARGANGIDGWISAAAGTVQATGQPTLALLGDVTAAHDLSGLGLAARARAPLALVVLDNAGGHIFDHLPARTRLDERTYEYLTTPPAVDFGAACRAHGVDYVEVRRQDQIEPAVRVALERRGATLVRIVVDPTSTREFLANLSRAAGGAA